MKCISPHCTALATNISSVLAPHFSSICANGIANNQILNRSPEAALYRHGPSWPIVTETEVTELNIVSC